MSRIVWLLSGEWMLKKRANSGGIVLARSLFIAVLTFAFAIGMESYLAPGARFWPSLPAIVEAVRTKLSLFGVIFGGVYAALYSRFSSQWQYLAGLYNQLMSAEDANPRSELKGAKRERRMMWWQAFIADALDLHLALKPTFAEVVRSLLREPEIDKFLRGTTPKDLAEFEKLKAELRIPLVIPPTTSGPARDDQSALDDSAR